MTKVCHECRALQFRSANDSNAAVIGVSVWFWRGFALGADHGTRSWHCVWLATFAHNSMLVSAPGRNPGNVIERMPELIASARAAYGPNAITRWDGLQFLGAVCVPNAAAETRRE